jgi:hypothetical protein
MEKIRFPFGNQRYITFKGVIPVEALGTFVIQNDVQEYFRATIKSDVVIDDPHNRRFFAFQLLREPSPSGQGTLLMPVGMYWFSLDIVIPAQIISGVEIAAEQRIQAMRGKFQVVPDEVNDGIL